MRNASYSLTQTVPWYESRALDLCSVPFRVLLTLPLFCSISSPLPPHPPPSYGRINHQEQLVSMHVPGDADGTWFGLHETEFAYAWADRTPMLCPRTCGLQWTVPAVIQRSFVNFLRCLNRTRFLLGIPILPDGKRYLVLRAIGSLQIGALPYIAPQLLSWNEANQFCADSVRSAGFTGSLASIDSGLVQEFVSSLLDGLPLKSTSAWIGLKRIVSGLAPKMIWADGSPMRYLRSVYRSRKFGIYNDRLDANEEVLIELCSAIYRSTYPRINGLWLQMSCDLPILLPAVCQAIPTAWTEQTVNPPISSVCPPGFHPGTSGDVASSTLSKPMCYRILDPSRKMTWQNWTWNSSEPVRYTDWFIPPTPSPSGCYVFHSNPHHHDDPMSISGLGSLRPESTCEALHYAICQTVASRSQPASAASSALTTMPATRFVDADRIPSRPSCFRLDETRPNSLEYRTDVVRSVSAKPCIR
ncbi:unnamed protein product [Echinostoma caproni]|uniref:C-type lectin domain-containing protein n=1 Tax=Echinostoma caproni TaxID=27848 RepID=A0A183B2X5_9TREM|nr:unnamed protein product [Echinostoma caproni]